jgi:hypothetical protein
MAANNIRLMKAQNHTLIFTEILKLLPFSSIAKLPYQMITKNEILPNKKTLYLDSSVPSAYFYERVVILSLISPLVKKLNFA